MFHDHYTGQALNKEKVVEAVRNDLDEMYSFSVLQWRRRSEKPASEKVISTTLFHKLKNEGTVRSRIVLRQFADVPLHEPSTNLVAETDITFAFFHAWLRSTGLKRPRRWGGLGRLAVVCPDEVKNMFDE